MGTSTVHKSLLVRLLTPVAAILASAGMSVSGAYAASGPASGAASAGSAAPMVRHYTPSGIVINAVGIAQCSKSVTERSGDWFCPTSASGPSKAAKPDVLAEFCDQEICYYELNTQSDEEEVNGTYGDGTTTLGTIRSIMTDAFNGGSSTTNPFWLISSRTISSWGCSGERMYFSASYPNGKGVNGGASYQTDSGGSAGGSAQEQCWGNTGGYKQYEDSVTWGGIAHQWQWTDPEYYGTWWFYAISPKFQRQGSGAYNMLDPFTFGPTPFTAAWTV
jgi:hypothetical protein